jgi:hypothetical protein
MITLTKAQVRALNPCSSYKYKHLFIADEAIDLQHCLNNGVSISDLLWVAGKLGLKRQCVQFALKCAQSVANLNTDPRVQAALDATQNWLDNQSNAYAAYAAADAARAAARAAYAADAADAARAAARAAYAYATDAAYAASAARAAYAAYAASAARAAYAAADADAYAAYAAAYAAYAAADADAYAAYAARAASPAADADQKQWFIKIFS